jgi:hypothetical protein
MPEIVRSVRGSMLGPMSKDRQWPLDRLSNSVPGNARFVRVLSAA